MEPWINITDSVTKIKACLRFDQNENKDFNLNGVVPSKQIN